MIELSGEAKHGQPAAAADTVNEYISQISVVEFFHPFLFRSFWKEYIIMSCQGRRILPRSKICDRFLLLLAQCIRDIIAIVFKFYTLFTHRLAAYLVAEPDNGLILSDHSRMDGLSGLKSYYPSTKDECEEGVEFATKVNDNLDALYLSNRITKETTQNNF